MVPEKGKPKGKQVSLLDAPEDKPDSIDSLVARAFDSDPKVRLKVAQELGKIDDPRSVFALIELSSDKEEAVKEAAQHSLGSFKEDAETIVSLEKMLQERKEQKSQPVPSASSSQAVSQQMAPSIEKLFSHYEPKKRELVKRKLFPSLQKFFGFSKQDWDPLRELDKISSASHASEQEETEELPIRPPVIPKEHIPTENAPNFPFGQKKEKESAPQPQDRVELDDDHEIVSSSDRAEEEFDGEQPSAEEMAHKEELSANRLYSLAYKIATTPGMGKGELKREQNRLLSSFKRDLGLAFKMAEERAKEEGYASFTNLKPGMKNLSFQEMQIVSISDTGFGAKKKHFAKVKLSDGHREVCVLIPSERAHGINQQDHLALKGVSVDFLVETNEIVLLVKNKSKIIVVK